MGISLAPDPAVDPNDPTKKKPAIPAPTVAAPAEPVDRVTLASNAFNTFSDKTQGAYDATSRDNIHNSAALGQIASGGLRTREGSLQLARGRDLDAMKSDLLNKATEGSIADASTAYQQALASSQQGLASELGHGNLDVAKGSLELEKTGQANATQLEKERLALAKTGQTASIDQSQQQIDLAKKTADIEAAYKAGTLTLAQKDQALRELSNSQGNANEQAKIALQAKALDAQEKYQAGTLTLAQRDQALRELAESHGNTLEQEKLTLAKDQLTQQGTQFGLSLAQQRELATLADKTANRQLDISSAQGKNSLLLELARIMGGTSGNVDPNFLAAVAKALGIALPNATTPPPTTTTPGQPPPTNTDPNPYSPGAPVGTPEQNALALAPPNMAY